MSEAGTPNFTPEQLEIFRRMATPTEFDPSVIARKHLNVQYGTLPEQILDIYLPEEGDGPWPLLLYVHGGGWSMGSKTLGALDCIIGAIRHGYALISLDYRLAPKVKFPEFLYDVKTAVRWARANAAQYGFLPHKFGMLGDSAGGHLTLMTGFTAGHPEYEGEEYGWPGVSSAVQAIVDLYGPTCLDADRDAWNAEAGVPSMGLDGSGPSIYDTAFSSDRDMLRLISPISYVHRDIPPTMILQGGSDPVVPRQHSIILKDKIRAVCGEARVELRLYGERTHSDGAFMTEETCQEIVSFFDRYLK